jgi:hypothetical protein
MLLPKQIPAALILAAALVVPAGLALAETGPLPATEARKHVGQHGTVCDEVDKVRYAQNTAGSPTFLYMGGKFPRHTFTVRVPGESRDKFNPSLESLEGKTICAIGAITQDSSRAAIEVSGPAQLKLAKIR